ncbi:APC family permease [Halorussus ruber]|uniref:APC family permease n=1 Tax=Halorussus ruber TaxID=1126238 RepID=UPI001092937B|nr:APC family permease [Halorussus ruber]
MAKGLERDLGLASVVAISIGAMVGSGIFILPALAVGIAGPAVVLAYLVAGILVLPAALSKAEMATAMPESGGSYVYIERGMGPLLGTIAGLGTWFSLSFKGALALVGGVPYLLLLVSVPDAWILPLTLGLAAALVVVNLVGAKLTGRLQVAIVAVMLAVMVWFVGGGAIDVQSANFAGFFAEGPGGLVAATGLVFVSYAGVTKVASVAEEIENPDRNIPLGILGSLAFTTLLYVLIVAVMVGVADLSTIGQTLTPMADVAAVTLGPLGVGAVVVAAVLALVSTANAGILSSSRYPFAMARDRLVPASLGAVHANLGTPVPAISLTGGVLLVFIAFVPIMEIAKLASAFQILVFVLVNAAVVAFREGHAEYEPSFRAPLYPWTQVFGVVTGLVLLTQMGTVPLVGAAAIIAVGLAWYLGYARQQVEREGAAIEEVRRRVGQDLLEETREALSQPGYEVLVGVGEQTPPERERKLVRVAADAARAHDGGVSVVRFDVEPDQVPLSYAAEVQSPGDEAFEEFTAQLADEVDVPVSFGEVVTHDAAHAVVNVADEHDADLLLLSEDGSGLEGGPLRDDVQWVRDHAPCDVGTLSDDGRALADDSGARSDGELGDVADICVVTDSGPYDPVKLALGDALASVNDARMHLEYRVGRHTTDRRADAIDAYHGDIRDVVESPGKTLVARPDGGRVTAPDLTLVSADDPLDDDRTEPVLTVHLHDRNRPSRFRRLLERLTF